MIDQLVEPPGDTPEYMYPAWVSCLFWAVGDADVLKRFETDTGLPPLTNRDPITRMVDHVTGFERDWCLKFGEWFNKWIWGSMDESEDDDGGLVLCRTRMGNGRFRVSLRPAGVLECDAKSIGSSGTRVTAVSIKPRLRIRD